MSFQIVAAVYCKECKPYVVVSTIGTSSLKYPLNIYGVTFNKKYLLSCVNNLMMTYVCVFVLQTFPVPADDAGDESAAAGRLPQTEPPTTTGLYHAVHGPATAIDEGTCRASRHSTTHRTTTHRTTPTYASTELVSKVSTYLPLSYQS